MGAGGGGGGGYPHGGGGGHEGSCDFSCSFNGGGGGGGGGLSQVGGLVPVSLAPVFFPSTRPCGYKNSSQTRTTCNGAVTLSWVDPLIPAPVPLVLPGGLVPLGPPQIRVLALDLTAAAKQGLPVSVGPTSTTTSVRLELFQRRKGKWRRAKTLIVNASLNAANQYVIPLPRKVRRSLLHSRRLKGRRVGRMRIDAFDNATGQPISSQQLDLN